MTKNIHKLIYFISLVDPIYTLIPHVLILMQNFILFAMFVLCLNIVIDIHHLIFTVVPMCQPQKSFNMPYLTLLTVLCVVFPFCRVTARVERMQWPSASDSAMLVLCITVSVNVHIWTSLITKIHLHFIFKSPVDFVFFCLLLQHILCAEKRIKL